MHSQLRQHAMMCTQAILLSLFFVLNFAYADDRGPLTAIAFKDVHIADSFWTPRIKTNQTATIEANLHQCEITGRIKNFAVAGKLEAGKHQGFLYNDSDVYKMIEGIAYTLTSGRDPKLEERTDDIIRKIAAAQQPDGYLNTYYTLVEPAKRWHNIQHGHELYCAGHLMEAAVAYFQATGKRTLLDVACKYADYIDSVFGPGKKIDCCGHEEIELALIKLFRVTNEKRYLNLARFFLDVRGHSENRKLFGDYAQDHKPIREQIEVTGHAVRAMYLYSAMADMAAITGDRGLFDTVTKIWHDVVERKMYITGGIGPSAHNEGFTVPYDLPNDSAYAETCAAIGMALWNHRMFLMTGDAKYADILEREVYNGLISGVSLTGERFFYVNPLGSKGRHHRVPWFDCSCCPTNVVRYIPGMGERVYATRGQGIWTVLYMGASAEIPLGRGTVGLKQETNYPWSGDIRISVNPKDAGRFALHLRIPGWCKEAAKISVNDKLVEYPTERGYAKVERDWAAGDVVHLQLPMKPERVYADPKVKADLGRVALQYGPVVYCVEGADNDGMVRNLVLSRESPLTATFVKDLLGGIVAIRGQATAVTRNDVGETVSKHVAFQAIPYCLWDNRKPGPMVVWLPESAELAEIPGEEGKLSNGIFIRASHVNATDSLEAMNDERIPSSSKDHSIPRMTWWDHRGTEEWVAYCFSKPRRITSVEVYWFDDTGRGACRVPAEWQLLWLDGKEWKPVQLSEGSTYQTALDKFNRVSFNLVRAHEIKLQVKLKDGFSGGILEWRVSGP